MPNLSLSITNASFAVSSSYAETASYALNGGGSTITWPVDFETSESIFTAGNQTVVSIDTNGNPLLTSLTNGSTLGFDGTGNLALNGNSLNTANGLITLDGSDNLDYPTTSTVLADASGNLYWNGTILTTQFPVLGVTFDPSVLGSVTNVTNTAGGLASTSRF